MFILCSTRGICKCYCLGIMSWLRRMLTQQAFFLCILFIPLKSYLYCPNLPLIYFSSWLLTQILLFKISLEIYVPPGMWVIEISLVIKTQNRQTEENTGNATCNQMTGNLRLPQSGSSRHSLWLSGLPSVMGFLVQDQNAAMFTK